MNEQQRIKSAQQAIKAICAEFGIAIVGTISARQVGEQIQVEPGNSIRIVIDPGWQPNNSLFGNRKQRRQAEKLAKRGQAIPDSQPQQQQVDPDDTTPEDEGDAEPIEHSNGKLR